MANPPPDPMTLPLPRRYPLLRMLNGRMLVLCFWCSVLVALQQRLQSPNPAARCPSTLTPTLQQHLQGSPLGAGQCTSERGGSSGRGEGGIGQEARLHLDDRDHQPRLRV